LRPEGVPPAAAGTKSEGTPGHRGASIAKLAGLQAHDERLAKIFECRYFAGLSEEETAEALGTSLRTVQRGWMKARAWLRDALESGAAEQ
jgi:DNA-directed RNA polymerase specialized sigma24 family protein